MGGLCGWIGGGSRDGDATLVRMAEPLPGIGSPAVETSCGADHGLALKSTAGVRSFAADGAIACAVQGELFLQDPQARELARAKGHALALIDLYRRADTDLLNQITGAFSLAVVDAARKRAVLAIDRFGIEPLCYGQARDGALVFGSTTDSVRAHGKVPATLSVQSIFDFLYCVDRVPAPNTIYVELRKLAPAECLVFENGRVTVRPYWHMPYGDSLEADKAGAQEELRRRLRASVGAAVAGEDPATVGTFLSGGLDSSTVTALAAEKIPRVKSFTIGFPVEGYDETRYAELVARRFGTAHHTYVLQPQDVADALLESVEIYDEPFANSSAIPAYYCAKAAREAGVHVMLAGDGGDELFAGNARYVTDRVFDIYAAIPSVVRRAAIEPLVGLLSRGSGLALARKAARYVELANLPVPERILHGLFLSVDPAAIFSGDALRHIDVGATRTLMRAIYDAPAHAGKVQRMMHFDLRVTLADGDLRKVGRMCDLAGVRVKYPFLEEGLAEFSARIPERVLLEGGQLRSFYKQAMHGFLPPETLTKSKHGFGLPYFDFVTSHAPLRDLACDALIGLKERGHFRPDFLDQIVARLRGSSALPLDSVAWDLLVLELWLQSRG
jgi:asparagine synthase (glutamine-hydrolysing)